MQEFNFESYLGLSCITMQLLKLDHEQTRVNRVT